MTVAVPPLREILKPGRTGGRDKHSGIHPILIWACELRGAQPRACRYAHGRCAIDAALRDPLRVRVRPDSVGGGVGTTYTLR